jgi:uncharacterized protein YecE (DUF72 family)
MNSVNTSGLVFCSWAIILVLKNFEVLEAFLKVVAGTDLEVFVELRHAEWFSADAHARNQSFWYAGEVE